jgi:hypothetical protein
MIEITFGGKKIEPKDINIFIANDLTFSIIVFIWYILFQLGIYKSYSPLFALIITFIQNMIILALLFYNKKINVSNIIRYLTVLVVIKVLPILSFYPEFKVTFGDVIFTFLLYVIYIIIMFIILKLYNPDYNITKKIMEDITGKSLKDDVIYYTYDYTYDNYIKQILY